MADIDTVQAFSLVVAIVWAGVGGTTIPWLIIAAHGARRNTLMTVALLSILGLLLAFALYDSAASATHSPRSTRLWVDLYLARVTSLLMAVVLSWRVWRVMLGATIPNDGDTE